MNTSKSKLWEKGIRGSVKTPESIAGICTKCVEQPKHVTRTGRQSPWCRGCINAAGRDYSARHPEETRKAGRENARTRKFGLTPQLMQELLDSQDNRCSICGVGLSLVPHSRPIAHVDHDHETNEVRSILCHNCNVCLGQAHDSISILEAMIVYLRKHGKR